MEQKIREYTSDAINVRYDIKRCIHAEECIHGAPAVFDTSKRPWIQPDQAPADEIATVIERCPTGALHYERHDGGAAESTPTENTIRIGTNGPLYMRGNVSIADEDGNVLLQDTRVAMCRCGASHNKPLCDNSHLDANFQASGTADHPETNLADITTGGEISLIPTVNGPLVIEGNFEILNADKEIVYRGDSTALCRCGGSKNKPFCDGSHHIIGFKSE